MKSSEVLRRAKARISDPTRWCCGHFARSAAGVHTTSTDPRARSWCAIGAVLAESETVENGHLDSSAIRWLARVAGAETVGSLNDRVGHAGVMNLFDEAIAASELDGD